MRDFDDAYIGSYFGRDTGYAKLSYLFGRSLLLVAEGSGGAVSYPDQPASTFAPPAGWTDIRVAGKLFGEYRVIDSIGINAELGYTGYFSNTVLTPSSGSGIINDALAFQRFRAFLGARWFM